MTDTTDETRRQASAEFDDTPPLDSDGKSDEENPDEDFGGEEDEDDEGVH